MGFPGAGSADENRVASGVEESAVGHLAHLAFIDGSAGEGEAVDVLENREFSAADPVDDRPGVPVVALGAQETGQQGIDLVTAHQPLAGDLVETGPHAMKLEVPHGLEDLVAFHHATFLMLS